MVAGLLMTGKDKLGKLKLGWYLASQNPRYKIAVVRE